MVLAEWPEHKVRAQNCNLRAYLLGRKAEGIKADWMQHIAALHTLVPGNDVCGGVALCISTSAAGCPGVAQHQTFRETCLADVVAADQGTEVLVALVLQSIGNAEKHALPMKLLLIKAQKSWSDSGFGHNIQS